MKIHEKKDDTESSVGNETSGVSTSRTAAGAVAWRLRRRGLTRSVLAVGVASFAFALSIPVATGAGAASRGTGAPPRAESLRAVALSHASGQPGMLDAVSCTASACEAVGTKYANSTTSLVAEAYDVRTKGWSSEPMPLPKGSEQASLLGVSCTSDAKVGTFCMAVGSYVISNGDMQVLAEKFESGAWSLTSATQPGKVGVDSGPVLTSVSCLSASFCLGGGYLMSSAGRPGVLVEKWSGRSWSAALEQAPRAGSMLRGLSCSSTHRCVGVGALGNGDLIVDYDGSSWKPVSAAPVKGSDPVLWSVSCTALHGCAATGASTDTTTNDYVPFIEQSSLAGTWKLVAAPAGSPSPSTYPSLDSISCDSAGSCTAVGGWLVGGSFADSQSLIETRGSNGSWTVLKGTPVGSLLGDSCGLGPCLAVGSENGSSEKTLVLERSSSTKWVEI